MPPPPLDHIDIIASGTCGLRSVACVYLMRANTCNSVDSDHAMAHTIWPTGRRLLSAWSQRANRQETMQAPNEAALDRAMAGVQYAVSRRLLQVSGNAVPPGGDPEA